MDLGFLTLIVSFGIFIILLVLRSRRTKSKNLLLLVIGFGILELGFIGRVIADFQSIYIDSQLFAISPAIFIIVLIIFLIYEITKKEISNFILLVLSFISLASFLILSILLVDNSGTMELLIWIRELMGLAAILLLLIHLFRFRDYNILFLFFGFISLVVAAFLFNTTSLIYFVSSLLVGVIILITGEFVKFKNKVNKDENIYSIRYKISFVIISLVVVILGSISGYSYFINSSQTNAEFKTNIDVLSHAKAKNLQTLLHSYLRIGTSFGEEIIFNNYLKFNEETSDYEIDLVNISGRSEFFVKANSFIYKIKLLDIAGKVIYSTDQNDIGADKSTEDYYIKNNKSIIISEIHKSRTTNEFGFDIAMPILDTSDDLLAILVVDYYAEELFDLLSDRIGMKDTGEFYLVNSNFYVMSPSRFFSNNELTLKDESENVQNCFDEDVVDHIHYIEDDSINFASNHSAEEVVSTYRGYRGNLVLGTHVLLMEPSWCLVANIDESELRDPINIVLITYFIISIFAVFVSGLISNYFSKKISQPIKELQEGVEIIEKGDHQYKVSTDAKDEVGDLSRAFDKMTRAINESKKEINLKVRQQTKEIVGQRDKMMSQQKAVLNILEDVEEEKDKSDKLAQDLQKFELAVSNASDVILITDADGIVLYANTALEEITGFKEKDVIGRKAGIKELWGGSMGERFYEELWKVIKVRKKVFIGEMKNHKVDGKEYIAAVSISPILDESGEVEFFVALQRDITKEKEIDKAKTEFVSLASHQLRTPLSTINWYSEMLLDEDVGKLNKEQKEYIKEIYDGNQRMVDLVNALLNVSRIDLGTMAIEPEDIKLVEISDSVIKEMAPQIKTKQMNINKKYGKSIPIISADRKLIRIIFQNFISNAVKYTPEKGNIEIEIKKVKNEILISVADNGYGIPKNQQSQIFTKLFRADNIRKTDTEGTGLGLYIIKSIVEQSGGKIWFDSEENKGTKFSVLLPLDGMKSKDGSKGLEYTS